MVKICLRDRRGDFREFFMLQILQKIAPVWDLRSAWLTSSPTFAVFWCYIISLSHLAAHSIANCSERKEKFIVFSKSLSLSCVCVKASMIQLLNAQERERELIGDSLRMANSSRDVINVCALGFTAWCKKSSTADIVSLHSRRELPRRVYLTSIIKPIRRVQ